MKAKNFTKTGNTPRLLLLSLSLLLLLASAAPGSAHVVGGIEKEADGYKVQFGSEPRFPVAGQTVKLLFSVQNATTGKDLRNFQAKIELSRDGETLFEVANVRFLIGDIEIPYRFNEPGDYLARLTLLAEKTLVFDFPLAVGAAVELVAPEAAMEAPQEAESAAPPPEAEAAQVVVATLRPLTFDFPTAISILFAIGVIPAYVGGAIGLSARRLRTAAPYFLASVGIGIIAAQFFDSMSAASWLGIEFGFGLNLVQAILVLSFAAGLLSLPAAERIARPAQPGETALLPTVAVLMAVGVGLHSFGEGIVIGIDLQTGFALTFLAATLQALSFALHKLGEGLVVFIPLLFVGRLQPRHLGAVGLAIGAPLMVGLGIAFLGIPGIISSFSFAAGSGALLYMAIKLVPLALRETGDLGKSSYILFVGMVVGVLYMYVAGLFHTTRF